MTIRRFVLAATLLAAAFTSTPATANPRDAAFASSGDRVERHTALFSGATLRVGLDGRRGGNPQLALRVAGSSFERDGGSKIGEGLAIGAAGSGRARITISGQDSRIVGQQLGLSKGATIALVVGAVVVVGLAVAVASSDGVDLDDDDCGSFVSC